MPEPKSTTPDYLQKQKQIMGASTVAVQQVLAAVVRLKECGGLLAQSGGNFMDEVFTPPTQFAYLDSYHANVLLQQAAPGLDAFLDTKVNNDSGLPTYRQLFQMCASGPASGM